MQSRQAGHWQTAIRRLWAKHYRDQDTAELMWDLADQAILSLEVTGWGLRHLRRVLVPASGDTTWTPRRVRYFRLSQDPPLLSSRASPAIMADARRWKRMSEVYQAGWGNYVGRSEEINACLDFGMDVNQTAEELGTGWTADLVARWRDQPWDTLSAGEVDILGTLAEARQPVPRENLPSAYRRTSGTQSCLGLLVSKGLVVRCGRLHWGGPMTYALAPGVCRYHPETKTPTSLDRMGVLLGWG